MKQANCIRAISLALVFSVICLSGAAAQDEKNDQPRPDRWRGLVIDQSTPEDAIKTLGKPNSDKPEKLYANGIDENWLTAARKEKIFRTMIYKKLEGVKAARLAFKDDRLVLIDLYLEKEIPAAAIGRIYGLEFTPRVSGLSQALRPQDFERNQGRVYPKTYPAVYNLVAVAPQTFVTALVGNVGFGKVLRETAGIPDSADSFPGKVAGVSIISRKLENKDGADALK